MMVTSDEISKFTPEQRDAWMNSLSDDQTVILHAAPGYRYVVAMIAEVKYFLAQDIPADARLRMLEFLDKQTDIFSVEAIAVVRPMPKEGREILHEAMKLGRKWLDAIARWEVFSALVAINPSILTALRMPSPRRYQHG